MKHLICLSTSIFLISCLHKKIEITPEYIINENWNERANAIKINKLVLKKDSILDLADLNQADVTDKLKEDSSFIFYANVKIEKGNSYKGKKIYFNRDNGFIWGGEDPKDTIRVIGNLEKGSWYKFSYLLTYPYFVFIYIDSANNVHRQDSEVSNF